MEGAKKGGTPPVSAPQAAAEGSGTEVGADKAKGAKVNRSESFSEKHRGLRSSKIPRPINRRGSESKSSLTKVTSGLGPKENRYRALFAKYNKDLMDMAALQEKLIEKRATLSILRSQIGKDVALPQLPDEEEDHKSTGKKGLFRNRRGKERETEERLRLATAEADELRRRLASLQSVNESQTAFVQQVKKDMPSLEGRYSELRDEVRQTEERQGELETRLTAQARMVEEFSALVNQSSIDKNKLGLMQAELEGLRRELKERDEGANAVEVERTSRKLEEERAAREKLEMRLREVIEEKERGAERLKVIEGELEAMALAASLEASVDPSEVERMRRELGAVKRALVEAETAKERTVAELEAARREVEQQGLRYLEDKTNLLASVREESSKMEAEIVELVDTIDTLKATLDSERARADVLLKKSEEAQKEVERLKSELEEVGAPGGDAPPNPEPSSPGRTADMMEKKVAELRETVEIMQTALEREKMRADEFSNASEEAEKELEKLKTQLCDSMEEGAKLAEELERLRAQYGSQLELTSEQVNIYGDFPVEVMAGSSKEEMKAPADDHSHPVEEVPGGYEEMFTRLEEKRRCLERLERRLEEVERSHERCALKRSLAEARMAQLEFQLAACPNQPTVVAFKQRARAF